MEADEQLLLGIKRIGSILKTRRFASMRQLESKISEAGQGDQLVQPHILSQSLKQLEESGIVGYETHLGSRFYFIRDKFQYPLNAENTQRKEDVLGWSRMYRDLTQDKRLCGDALETVIRITLTAIGWQPRPIAPGAAFDFEVMVPGGSVLIAGEAKNYREWIYPSNKEVWDFMEKAARRSVEEKVPILPIFIARKIQGGTCEIRARVAPDSGAKWPPTPGKRSTKYSS